MPTLDEIYTSTFLDLLYFTQYKVRDKALAFDIVQDVFVRFIEVSRKQEISDPRGWLYRSVRNLIIDRWRVRKHNIQRGLCCLPDINDEELYYAAYKETFDEDLDREKRAEIVRRSLGPLSDTQRECIRLRGEGLHLSEIGERLNVDLRRVSEAVILGTNIVRAALGIPKREKRHNMKGATAESRRARYKDNKKAARRMSRIRARGRIIPLKGIV